MTSTKTFYRLGRNEGGAGDTHILTLCIHYMHWTGHWAVPYLLGPLVVELFDPLARQLRILYEPVRPDDLLEVLQ